MKTRRFGRSGHDSTLAIFGAAAFSICTQAQADETMQRVLAAGVNHIDVAPSYGMAEERLAPWMPKIRDQFFVGCKTMERTRAGAAAEMRRSLHKLNMQAFDLYQIHAITTQAELDAAMGPDGALEAIREAREQGLTRHIGITGHGFEAPALFLEALRRFDFDSVLFPINFVQYANPVFRTKAEELLKVCRARDVGVMIIKSITRAPYGDRPHTHNTWYEPFTEPEKIQSAVNFVLSQDVTGICTAGDMGVLPLVLHACEHFTPLSPVEQAALIDSASQYAPLFEPAG